MRSLNARTHAAWPAPPTPRGRGRAVWIPPRSVWPRPGPRLQLAGDRPEPAVGGGTRLASPGPLMEGAGLGAVALGAVAAGMGR